MARPSDADSHGSEDDDQLPALHTDAQLPIEAMNWTDTTEDAETTRFRTPPPHIAERFYRSKTNRRRSSAASSRRNSITSSHSTRSNRSFGTSLHRNTIAQHLRRASILEDRKARLQERAAHAEQVRLRAAQAKAAPRSSNTEEKALAAQQAREQHLAKVAAACAEEVSRSKRIAEENKERRAAEERRSRQELEDKHAEAEKRRLEYKKHPRRVRTTSQANAEDAKPQELRQQVLGREQACVKIQTTWRRSRRRRCAVDFQDLKLSIERIGQISFEDAFALLADKNVIERTGGLLLLMGLDLGTKEDATPIRTFLSAFMMLGHPNTIFNRSSEQEQDLISKARDLLIGFEAVLAQYTSSVACVASPTNLQDLCQSHTAYLTAFDAWKKRDATVLIETMIDQFVSLDAIWQTVKDDTRGEVAADYRSGIRDQQVILYSKIKKLAGPERADSLIKRAINQSRRQRSRRRPIREVRPRQLEAQVPEGNETETTNPAATSDRIIDHDEQQRRSDRQPTDEADLSRVFSVIPSNRLLVHELMIDPNYKVEPAPQANPKDILNREVCESLRRGVAVGESEIWTVVVAENIRSRLLKLLQPGNSFYNLLNEVLDSNHVRTQCRHGQFSYDNFFIFMADLLPRLCAPVRDEEVKTLANTLKCPTENTDAMVEKLYGLLHVIDSLSLDHTNYLIREQAALLIREGVGYEQRLFQVDLDNSRTSLARTTQWWRNATLNLVTESSLRDPQPTQQRPAFPKIYSRGLVDLAVGSGQLRDTDLPETLALDATRLSRIRSNILRFITVGGVLLTAKNLLKRDVRSQWKPEAKRVYDALQKGYTNTTGDLSARILAIVESGHGMPASSTEQLANIIRRFLNEAQNGHLRDPVLKLLLQRLKGHLFNRLAAQSSVERVRVASTTSEGLANIGLGEFIGQIGACADELGKIMQVDVQSHGVWLRRIAEEADGLGTRSTPQVS